MFEEETKIHDTVYWRMLHFCFMKSSKYLTDYLIYIFVISELLLNQVITLFYAILLVLPTFATSDDVAR